MPIVPRVVALLLVGLLAACSTQPGSQLPPTSPPMTDADLIQAIRDARDAGATPLNVESEVGVAPILNTARPGDRDILAFAQIELDPNEQSEITSLDASDLVYWDRPGEQANVDVVGLAWTADPSDPARLFFAVVYPP